jgi:hypothetical protein
MHRWTAGFLLLVMLVPGFTPLALARSAAPEAMHCMRQPLHGTMPAAEPAMPCHHGMVKTPKPPSSEASLRALNCCQNHDCCRTLKTSERARPAASQFSFVRLLIEPALSALFTNQRSVDLPQDSARAPPRS